MEQTKMNGGELLEVTVPDGPMDNFIQAHSVRGYYELVVLDDCANERTWPWEDAPIVVENMRLSLYLVELGFHNQLFSLDSKPDSPIVFRNCTFSSCMIDTVFTIHHHQPVVFENCMFENEIRFVISRKSQVNCVNCTFTTSVKFSGDRRYECLSGISRLIIDNCSFRYKVPITDVDNVLITNRINKSVELIRPISIMLYNIPKHDKNDSRITVNIMKMTDCPCASLTIKSCRIQDTRININDSVLDILADSSSVGTLGLYHTIVTSAHLRRAWFNFIGADESMCTSHINGQYKVNHVFASGSYGFTKKAVRLYKKANFVITPRFGYKKPEQGEVIVELAVPKDADKHLSDPDSNTLESTKIRVSKALVVGFFHLDGKPLTKPFLANLDVCSRFDPSFHYKYGHIARPAEKYDTSCLDCSSGIHGFLTFEEAKNY